MLAAVLLTIAKKWKQFRCPWNDKWMNKKWYIHIREYYLNIVLLHAPRSKHFGTINLNERSYILYDFFP